MYTEIYLIRHGETMFNQLNKVQGWADSPLTVKGINDLRVTASNLSQIHFDRMYSSDLKRAIDTVHLIKDYNMVSQIGKIKKLPAFREAFFGGFEGDDIYETWRQVSIAGGMKPETNVCKIIDTLGIKEFRNATKKADERHLAENAKELDDRIMRAVHQIKEESDGLNRVLLVTHGDFIKSLGIKYWTQYSGKGDIEFPTNGSMTRGIFNQSGKFEIVDYNINNSDLINI